LIDFQNKRRLGKLVNAGERAKGDIPSG